MNETIRLLLNRKSARACEGRAISAEDKELLVQAILRNWEVS